MSDLNEASPWRFCVAPMMQRTDRHFRYLSRLIAPRARLYTEMITTGALLHGDRDRFLRFHPLEHPVGIQLGGSSPAELADCARLAAERGFDEVNLNCGCPSDRVQSGRFGACLMREPALVADCVTAMRDALPGDVAVSVKLRLGVDDLYEYGYFRDFVGTLATAGCRVFHVHARKAWLSGLSPRENRELPPLEYDWVYRLKAEFPALVVVLNGGIREPDAVPGLLSRVDGIMVGRRAYEAPASMAAFEQAAFAHGANGGEEADWTAVVERYIDYVDAGLDEGTPLTAMSRHLLNLFPGRPGARRWRRHLTEQSLVPAAGSEVIRDALRLVVAGSPALPFSASET